MKKIYIAGPYTNGDTEQNVHNAMDAANEVINAGLVPFVPHLTHYLHERHPHPYETWIAIDLAFLMDCDVLLRLPGESPGADREVEYANAWGIPVFYSMESLLAFTKGVLQ